MQNHRWTSAWTVRGRLVAVVAATALVLTACGGSEGGSPTTAPSAATSAASSAESSAPSSSAGGSTSESSTPSGAGSSTADSSTADSSTADSSTAGSSSSEPSSESSSEEGPTQTLDGVVDADTVTWFTTLCGGLSQSMQAATTELTAAMTDADPKAGQVKVVDILTKMGEEYTATSAALSTLPPPSIDRGDEIAAAFTKGLSAGGDALVAAAAKVGSATVTSTQELTAAVSSATDEVSSAMAGIGDGMDNIDLTPELQKQLEEIPACKDRLGTS